MEDCIFCKIVRNEMPCDKVYEDKNTLAFLDINPVHPGHTLVIHKNHSKNIFDIPESDFLEVMKTVKKITPAIKKAVKADGINIGISNEKAANQVILHLHVHIMPRYENDGLKMFPAEGYKNKNPKKIAERIKLFIE